MEYMLHSSSLKLPNNDLVLRLSIRLSFPGINVQ